MFVKLDNSLKAVPYQTMSDYYVFSKDRCSYKANAAGGICIGDRVKIQVAKADTIRRLVDLYLSMKMLKVMEPVRIDDAEQERIRERSVAFHSVEDRESQPHGQKM